MKSARLAFVYVISTVFVILALTGLIMVLQSPPSGPREIVWDKQPCRACGMSVSDREFACQLQTEGGDIHDFDDPGCLFQFVLREKPSIRATFFRRINGDDWIAGDQVGFVSTERSPMDYGLAAVPQGEVADSLTLNQAIAEFEKKHLQPMDRGN